ncbi:MAG: UvrD-helicase domain-containing protein [Candidatus Omnitrophica bacterium]|nr:UvrD-helicase domain-containing protein [Candidatus Omnitrophota bacterium]
MGPEFTAAQKEAIETFDRNVFVFASAGSGKTTLLVERFIHAVTRKSIDPQKILAITFTEKAASEMKRRLVRECDQRGLVDSRRRLENAPIGTIHGFCARLLRENPVESALDPFFQILGEGEAEILFSKTLDRLFEEEADNAATLRLLADFGEEAVRKALKNFYDQSRALGEEGLFRREDFAAEKKALEKKLAADLKNLSDKMNEKDATEPQRRARESLMRLAGLLKDSIKEKDPWNFLNAVLDEKKNLSKRTKFKDGIGLLHEQIDARVRFEIQDLARPVKTEFARLFGRFKSAYEKEKTRLAVYDFEDLLVLTHRLLSGDSPAQKTLRARTQNFFASVMVDEVQDTSPLQARIVDLLVNGRNLFAVGDVQQAIYGFRHADPEVFRNLGRQAGAGARNIVLSDNYRSRPEILEFVNGVCRNMTPGADFTPLRAMRAFPDPAPGAVELFYVSRKKEETLDQARVREARGVAARIRELAASGSAEYRDIAILLKATTSSYLFEKELEDLAIPFFVVKGSGFYEKPEVKDFIHLFKLIENPGGDISLAAVLRSGLVGLSDDALFWLARRAKAKDSRRPLASALASIEAIPELDETDRKKLAAFRDFLADLRANRNHLNVSEILHAALARTGYEAKALTHPEGRQKLANVRKLETLARTLEAKGIFGPPDFISFVKNASNREELEPEARIRAENAVTILTIHAAKGLEFPCVIVADLGGQGHRDGGDPFAADRKAGLGVKLKNPRTQKWMSDETFARLGLAKKKKGEEEEDRLFYVAMTRAKERLILSGVVADSDGDGDDPGRRPSWMGRLARAIGPNPAGVKILRAEEPEKVPAPRSVSLADEPFFTELLKEDGGARGAERLSDLEAKLRFPIRAYDRVQDLTVTDLLEGKLSREEPRLELTEDEDQIAPAEFGTLFHRLMEQAVLKRPRSFARWPFFTALTRGLSAAEKIKMRQALSKFWEGRWGVLVRNARRVYPELPFIYRTRLGLLKGQIDLVFETEKGEWVILDYKTNWITSAQKEAVAESYRLQISSYAFVFRELYGEAPKMGVLYFSAIDEAKTIDYAEGDFAALEKELSGAFEKTVRELPT